jgi:hypothetical protein
MAFRANQFLAYMKVKDFKMNLQTKKWLIRRVLRFGNNLLPEGNLKKFFSDL